MSTDSLTIRVTENGFIVTYADRCTYVQKERIFLEFCDLMDWIEEYWKYEIKEMM